MINSFFFIIELTLLELIESLKADSKEQDFETAKAAIKTAENHGVDS